MSILSNKLRNSNNSEWAEKEIERLQKLYDVAVADRVRMHEEIERLRAALEKILFCPKPGEEPLRKIAREALRDD